MVHSPQEGAVVKLAGIKNTKFVGKAKVFDAEEDAFEAISKKSVVEGDVVVIRYEGPKGGPGMREMFGNDCCHSSARDWEKKWQW